MEIYMKMINVKVNCTTKSMLKVHLNLIIMESYLRLVKVEIYLKVFHVEIFLRFNNMGI